MFILIIQEAGHFGFAEMINKRLTFTIQFPLDNSKKKKIFFLNQQKISEAK